jgi:hypothetical protein
MSQEKIVPDSWFYTEFRNLLDVPLYVWWAGTHGITVAPHAHFKVEGDPRIPRRIPGVSSVVASIKRMVEAGRIEFISSPAVILDNKLPDGQSLVLQTDGDNAVLTGVPTVAEAAVRVLPIYKPTVTPAISEQGKVTEIILDWTHIAEEVVGESETIPSCITNLAGGAGYDLNDKYKIIVTLPTGKSQTVNNSSDRQFTYIPKIATGTYSFKIVVVAVDKREQEGEVVEYTIPAIPT